MQVTFLSPKKPRTMRSRVGRYMRLPQFEQHNPPTSSELPLHKFLNGVAELYESSASVLPPVVLIWNESDPPGQLDHAPDTIVGRMRDERVFLWFTLSHKKLNEISLAQAIEKCGGPAGAIAQMFIHEHIDNLIEWASGLE
jgi:hypothetical protein